MSDWISGNYTLSLEQMQQNAMDFSLRMLGAGWSPTAIAAVLGNMQAESTINPGRWEGGVPYKGGYGLVQWTPYTKYSEWWGPGWENNGDAQCERILWEVANGEQWFANPQAPIVNPPLSFAEFTHSGEDVKTLANYFLWYYEHPEITIQPQRGENAVYWLGFVLAILHKRKKTTLSPFV